MSTKKENTVTEDMPAAEPIVKEEAKKTSKSASKPAKTEMRPKEVDPHEYITVRNGFQGRLVYISKRTGEKFVWEEFGDEQEIEVQELKNAKNSAKKMFINNWFMFDNDWVVDYLGMRRYYENALPIDGFDDLFKKPAEEIASIIGKLSDGQKKSVKYRARQLVADDEIDSVKTIHALEDALGIELIER